jgi:tetratricopeptide (TPR) repeat protein
MSAVNSHMLEFVANDVQERLKALSKDFYGKSPIEALAKYGAMVDEYKDSDAFVAKLVGMRQALQYLRAGLYKQAHIALLKAKPEVPEELNKDAFLYFEWVLVAKKVLFKQFFQQEALEMLLAACRVCFDLGQKDSASAPKLDLYRAKIYEDLGMIHAEHYFYKTAKSYMAKAMQVYEQHPELSN